MKRRRVWTAHRMWRTVPPLHAAAVPNERQGGSGDGQIGDSSGDRQRRK